MYHDLIACIHSGILKGMIPDDHFDNLDHFETSKKHLQTLNIPRSVMVGLYKAHNFSPDQLLTVTDLNHEAMPHIPEACRSRAAFYLG